MTSYSSTSLIRKLGLKPGMRVVWRNTPDGLPALLGPLPDDISDVSRGRGRADFIHAFVDSRRSLERALPTLARRLDPQGMLWLSWPKQSAGMETDLDGNAVRGIGLDAGLVDVKVCAVDEVWSALKFVYRRCDR